MIINLTIPSSNEEPASGRFGKTDDDNSRKYVTFSKNTEFEAPRLSSHNSRTSSLSISNNLKPDLPGRVSFSKNDDYELDNSDYENGNTETTDVIDDAARLKIIYQFHNGNKDSPKIQQTSTVETNGNAASESHIGTSAFCCSMKCNSSGCALTMSMTAEDNTPDTSKTEPISYDSRKLQYNDESNKIFEDYKREIEQLNRQHQKVNNEASLHFDKTDGSIAFNPEHMKYFDNDTDLEKSQSRSNSAKSLHNGSNASTAPLLVVPICKDTQLVEEKTEPSSKETNNAKSWINNDLSYRLPSDEKQLNRPKQYHQKPQTPECQPVREDSSTVVIQNYLKATNQDKTTTVRLSSKCNLAKPIASNKVSNETNKPRASSSKTSTKPTSSKGRASSKSAGNAREDSRLNEFHMDKVESWMSIHEFDKSDKDSGTSPENAHNEPYNQTWRETPSSKTDDEGNYSFEDHLDGESTYDEIVSVIKEIDDQKHLDMAIMDDYGIENENVYLS